MQKTKNKNTSGQKYSIAAELPVRIQICIYAMGGGAMIVEYHCSPHCIATYVIHEK